MSSPRKAIDAALITDDIVWRPEVCVDGGIFRAFATYTNPDVQKAFNELPGSYSGNYYDIRKYNKLTPGQSYLVNMTIETGSTEGIEQPRDWEEWEYGICGPQYGEDACCTEDCDQNVNFSGIKLISDYDPDQILEETSRNEAAQYGKSVAVSENLMAIGAPGLTIYDEYDNPIQSGGAVFLYRRNEDVAGKKAGWDLERKLLLPSGFIRDYVASTPGTAIKYPQNGETQFSIPFQQWEIGQEGREFGHSVALSSDGTKETVVVGAPHAAWSRTFADLNISGIPICMAVFTDKFVNNEEYINRVANEARVYDVLYTYFAERWNLPEFDFNPKLDIKILVYHFVGPNASRTPHFIKQNFLKHIYVDKLSNPGATVSDVADDVKSLFLDTFKIAETPHSGLPPIMGVFIEESPSTMGGDDINPVAQNFIDFYKSYTYQSGVIDPEFTLPNSGYVNTVKGTAENWSEASKTLLNSTLNSGNLFNNDALRYIASGFSDNANPALGTFQLAPPSGGKVYIFDKEGDDINLVQEIKTYYRRATTLSLGNEEDYDALMNLDYGGQDYHDRFGHAVDISKDGKIIAIGSPFTPRPCEVFERVDSETDRMYSRIRDWFVHASGRHDYNGLDNTRLDFSENVIRYDQLLAESGQDIARRQSYLELNPSDKFFYRTDTSFWGADKTIELYKKIYDYKYTDIPYTGTWGFISNEFAPSSRLGYSCAVSDSGNIVAFGAPTDSFNEFDDKNVWYGGVTNFESGNNRWASITNAGAVRVFESRKFYPHSGVVEFSRFGNLDRTLNLNNEDALYDVFDTYFGANIPEEGTKPRSFRRMGFEEKRIPQDAGLAFIITPERDVISSAGGQEVLEGIKEWLALGDRTLVLVANDPEFEDGGVYSKSTSIVNTILEKLGSRMVVRAARNSGEALLECVEVGDFNVVEAFQPEYNHTTFDEYKSNISTDNIYAMGVGDIKIKLRPDEVSVFSENGIQMPCNDPLRPLNPEPELPLKQYGDLRAQWNSICSKCGQLGCVEFEHKTNWPMYFDNPNPSQSCDQYPLPGNLDAPYQDPRPILTAARVTPDVVKIIPEVVIPETCYSGAIYKEVCTDKDIPVEILGSTPLNEVAFNIYENFGNENKSPSGLFNAFNLNTFTNPNSLNFINPILQAKGQIGDPIMVRDGFDKEVVSPDSPLVCEESPEYAASGSKVIMIASTRPETALNLGNDPDRSAGENDKNPAFYSSIVKKNCEYAGTIYQIGGWTGRESFADVMSDFDMEYKLEETRSDLYNLLTSHGHTVEENFTATHNYGNADVLWIADPLGYDEDEVQELIDFLTLKNKTVVITYNIQPTEYSYNQFGEVTGAISRPYDTIQNVTKICEKLGLDMKPAFSNLVGSYMELQTFVQAQQFIDYNYEIVSGCADGFEWLTNYKSEYTHIDYLTTYLDDPAFPGGRSEFGFVPIINSQDDKQIIKYADRLVASKPRYIEEAWFKMNADASVTFPVIANSGYRVFVNYVSETDDDKIDTEIVISTNSTADGEYAYDTLSKTNIGVVSQKFYDIDVGLEATEMTVAFNASSTEKIPADSVFVEPRSVRIVSISGCPLPKETITYSQRTCRSVFDRWEVTCIPGSTIPEQRIVIPGTLEPISTSRENYLAPNLFDCDTVTTEKTIEDGPVIAAEELENFSSFSAGKRRSRIVVVSDPTIIQGRCVHYRDRATTDNQKFLRSLYLPSPQEYKDEASFENSEYYDTGTKFEYVQKIRSPEAGSAGKYYALSKDPTVTRLFGEPELSPVDGNQALFRTDEDSFAPRDVYRKKNPHWSDIEAEKNRFLTLVKEDFGTYPRFSGVFQGLGPLTDAQKDHAGIPRFAFIDGEMVEINQIYYPRDQNIAGGISEVQRLTGRDYLDYIDSFSGCPGDLFGYAIDLSKDKLIVGTPFNGFAAGRIWDWLEVSGDPSLSGWKISGNGGAGAAFFFERTGQGTNATSQFLPFEFKAKIKPGSANVGVSGELTSSNILAQKGIGTERHADHVDEDFRKTDQFGRSVAVASDMFAIGAPNHDTITEHSHIYDGESAFVRKDFTAEFDIPEHEFIDSSGDPVLNDGAVYTYRYDLVDFGDRQKEVVFAEKLNKQRYKGRFASDAVDQYGTENDKFGISVAMHRSYRGDSDYTLVGGASNHDYPTSGDHPTQFMKNAGAAFTYDAMLREQPKVIPTEGGYICARTFGPSNTNNISLEVEQPTSGTPKRYNVSGVVSANRYGEIYLEASGYDPATRGFTIHRPYVKYITGKLIGGTPSNNNVNMVIPGVSVPASANMPLYIEHGGAENVYNNMYDSMNLAVSGASGVNTVLNLHLPEGVSGSINSLPALTMFTSGVGTSYDNLNLRVRGK